MSVASKLITFASGAAAGGAAAYFFDSQSGNRRRSVARDKARKYARRGAGAAQGVQAQAQAVGAKAQNAATGGDSAPSDDITLTRKVETEIFRDASAPKGSVNVQVVSGIVELRGQVDDQAQIEALEKAARGVTGVRAVTNLLHLPGETPANVAGTPGVS
jgi:osmotically-inducible protein OsmY